MAPLKILYMGTGAFAVPPLQAIAGAGYGPIVLTLPDRPASRRGLARVPTPVKAAAMALGLEAWTVPDGQNAKGELARYATGFDLAVVCDFGVLLDAETLVSPRLGAINIHGSLLPRHRGAAPVARAIMEGDSVAGVTIMQMDAGLDTGAVLMQASLAVGASETASALSGRLSAAGADLILEAIEAAGQGGLKPRPQNEDLSSYAAKITKAECLVDFAWPASRLACHIRALDNKPGAYAFLSGKRVKLFGASIYDSGQPGQSGPLAPPGRIAGLADTALLVGAGGGLVAISTLQPEGKRAMAGRDFLNGISGGAGEFTTEG